MPATTDKTSTYQATRVIISNLCWHIQVVPADPTLSGHLAEQVRREAGAECTVEGANVTADSFYSSQGAIAL